MFLRFSFLCFIIFVLLFIKVNSLCKLKFSTKPNAFISKPLYLYENDKISANDKVSKIKEKDTPEPQSLVLFSSVELKPWKISDSFNSTTLRFIFRLKDDVDTWWNKLESKLSSFQIKFSTKVERDIRTTLFAAEYVTTRAAKDYSRIILGMQEFNRPLLELPSTIGEIAAMTQKDDNGTTMKQAWELVKRGINPVEAPQLLGSFKATTTKQRAKLADSLQEKSSGRLFVPSVDLLQTVRALPNTLQYDYERRKRRNADNPTSPLLLLLPNDVRSALNKQPKLALKGNEPFAITNAMEIVEEAVLEFEWAVGIINTAVKELYMTFRDTKLNVDQDDQNNVAKEDEGHPAIPTKSSDTTSTTTRVTTSDEDDVTTINNQQSTLTMEENLMSLRDQLSTFQIAIDIVRSQKLTGNWQGIYEAFLEAVSILVKSKSGARTPTATTLWSRSVDVQLRVQDKKELLSNSILAAAVLEEVKLTYSTEDIWKLLSEDDQTSTKKSTTRTVKLVTPPPLSSSSSKSKEESSPPPSHTPPEDQQTVNMADLTVTAVMGESSTKVSSPSAVATPGAVQLIPDEDSTTDNSVTASDWNPGVASGGFLSMNTIVKEEDTSWENQDLSKEPTTVDSRLDINNTIKEQEIQLITDDVTGNAYYSQFIDIDTDIDIETIGKSWEEVLDASTAEDTFPPVNDVYDIIVVDVPPPVGAAESKAISNPIIIETALESVTTPMSKEDAVLILVLTSLDVILFLGETLAGAIIPFVMKDGALLVKRVVAAVSPPSVDLSEVKPDTSMTKKYMRKFSKGFLGDAPEDNEKWVLLTQLDKKKRNEESL